MAKLLGTDCVEFAVKDLSKIPQVAKAWGFEKLGENSGSEGRSLLYGQGNARLMFTQGAADSLAARWVDKHGDGISRVTLETTDVSESVQQAAKASAHIIEEPKLLETREGKVTVGSIIPFGDVIYTFVNRQGTKEFSDKISVSVDEAPKGFGIKGVDHLTNNVAMGEMEPLADFFEKGLGFICTRHFTITTGRTGLLSKVMQTPDGTVKMPLNEPTEAKSQIQEYLDVNKGPGVQHLAWLTGDISETLISLRNAGGQFLSVPDTYYDEVPARVPNVKEDIKQLQKLGVLLDGDAKGYLLQIFSQNAVGPFFYEIIQRRGNDGFGEGNFKALFQAIERDQEKRGVL